MLRYKWKNFLFFVPKKKIVRWRSFWWTGFILWECSGSGGAENLCHQAALFTDTNHFFFSTSASLPTTWEILLVLPASFNWSESLVIVAAVRLHVPRELLLLHSAGGMLLFNQGMGCSGAAVSAKLLSSLVSLRVSQTPWEKVQQVLLDMMGMSEAAMQLMLFSPK